MSSIDDLILSYRDGWNLAGAFYRDAGVFGVELERIFRQLWLYVGHISLVRNPGDYFLYDIDGESIIIIRDDNDDVHALFNVCRHRGSRLCSEENGILSKLVCPYHAWVYELDGSLQNARLMPDDFEANEYSLHRAHIEVLEGLIFICLADDPPSFDAIRQDVEPHLKPHEFDKAKICYTHYVDIKANWKIIAENSRECYHCGPAHPELCKILPFTSSLATSNTVMQDTSMTKAAESRWGHQGIATYQVIEDGSNAHRAFRVPFSDGCSTLSVDGGPVAPLMGKLGNWQVGILNTAVLPTFWMEAPADYAAIYRYTPSTASNTRARVDWLVNGDAVEGSDYEIENVIEMVSIINEQDWKLCEETQLGVSSRRYQPGRYSGSEFKLQYFLEWYINQIGHHGGSHIV